MEGDEPSAKAGQASGLSPQAPQAGIAQVDQGSAGASPHSAVAAQQAPAGTPPQRPPAQLPESYGTGRLLLVARDPHHLYTHWDVAAKQFQAHELPGGQPLALRMHLAATNGPVARELQVRAESRHWFVRVEREETTYVAELGYYGAQHEWNSLATSKPATTPRGHPVEERGFELARVGFERQLPGPSRPPESGTPTAAQPPGRRRLVVPKSAQLPLLNIAQQTALLSIQPGAPQPVPLSPGCQPPAQARARELGSEWGTLQEQLLSELIGAGLIPQEWIGSLELLEMLELQRGLLSPGIAEAPAVSSPLGLPKAIARGFWFNVNAELVIYGATEPNAQVSLGGRPIQLRQDGSFSLRFALPDGDYELALAATSAAGETRRAELAFSRSTNYFGDVGVHPQDPALKQALPGTPAE